MGSTNPWQTETAQGPPAAGPVRREGPGRPGCSPRDRPRGSASTRESGGDWAFGRALFRQNARSRLYAVRLAGCSPKPGEAGCRGLQSESSGRRKGGENRGVHRRDWPRSSFPTLVLAGRFRFVGVTSSVNRDPWVIAGMVGNWVGRLRPGGRRDRWWRNGTVPPRRRSRGGFTRCSVEETRGTSQTVSGWWGRIEILGIVEGCRAVPWSRTRRRAQRARREPPSSCSNWGFG